MLLKNRLISDRFGKSSGPEWGQEAVRFDRSLASRDRIDLDESDGKKDSPVEREAKLRNRIVELGVIFEEPRGFDTCAKPIRTVFADVRHCDLDSLC